MISFTHSTLSFHHLQSLGRGGLTGTRQAVSVSAIKTRMQRRTFVPVRALEYTLGTKEAQPSTLNRAEQGRRRLFAQVGLEFTGPSSDTLVPELERLVRHVPWWG